MNIARIWKQFLMAFILVTVFVAPILSGTPGASANGDAIYQEAEKLEWYKPSNMKEVDGLYEKAAKAGSDAAKMMLNYNALFMADPDSQKFAGLAKRACADMAEIAKKWGESADAEQNFQLARYYALPFCKTRDVKKSRALLEKSANAGNAKAEFYMGRTLSRKDAKGAFEWFSKAASQGFPQAIANQGACYLSGKGVEKDEKKGMELIDKALASGSSNTLYEIAIWYLEGKSGLPKDTGKAREILEKLAKKDYEPALLPLSDIESQASGK